MGFALRGVVVGIMAIMLGLGVALWGFEFQLITCSSGPGVQQCATSPVKQIFGISVLGAGLIVGLLGARRIVASI